jgi:hypothetical protein
VAVKRAEYRVRRNRQREMLRGQMRVWARMGQRGRKVKSDDEQSMKIYRHRFLTKYLSVWLHELHISLKLKHLSTLCDAFQRRGGLRRAFFSRWLTESRKSRYLSAQESSIQSHQVNLLTYKTFSALASHANMRKEETRKARGAEMQYLWWLARRAMTYLQYARWRGQKKRELEAEITQDYQARQRRRVFVTL